MKIYNYLLVLALFVLSMSAVLGATLNGSSSIYTFNVSNCIADDYAVGCGEQIIEYSCDITNSAFIDFAEFRIDGSLYNASKTGQNWAVNFLKLNQTSTINISIVLDRIYVTDTNSDTAVFDESVSVLHDCVTCSDVGTQDVCSIFDNTTIYHVFEPTGCQANFNETISCDYCSQDLNQVLGDCSYNNTQEVTYYDSNYFSCCDVTGLVSDCFIEVYPYNASTFQACSFLTQDFSCDFPDLAELSDKMNFNCLLPDNDDYKCVVNVFEDGRLLQVNPEFTPDSSSLINIGKSKSEPKEFFSPQNKLLNVYFTSKNLMTESEFMVEVVCSGDYNIYESQYLVEPFYNSAGASVNRVNWARENIGYLFVWLMIFFVLVVLLAFGFNKMRGKNTSR